MALVDGDDLKEYLLNVFPNLVIDDVAAISGQRVVYFCHFDEVKNSEDTKEDEDVEDVEDVEDLEPKQRQHLRVQRNS